MVEETPNAQESPELQKLAVELRELEIQERRLKLEKDQALAPLERDLKAAEVRARELENHAKSAAQSRRLAGVRWDRVGLLVAWLATLAPISYSAYEHWTQREEVLHQRQVEAAEARQTAIREAASRFDGGSSAAALELVLFPEGTSVLVGGVRGVAKGAHAADEIRRSLAALVALASASVELKDGQRGLLRLERDRGIGHLQGLAAKINHGRNTLAEKQAFLDHYEINQRLRLLLKEDGEAWKEAGGEIEKVHRNVLTEDRTKGGGG